MCIFNSFSTICWKDYFSPLNCLCTFIKKINSSYNCGLFILFYSSVWLSFSYHVYCSFIVTWNCFLSVDKFGENWSINDIESSNPWTWYIFPLIQIFFYYCQQYIFLVFCVQELHITSGLFLCIWKFYANMKDDFIIPISYFFIVRT